VGGPAAFIAVDLLVIVGSIDYFLGRTTITVGASGMSVRREWLGAVRTKSYDAATIASIGGATAGENSTSFGVSPPPRMLTALDQNAAAANIFSDAITSTIARSRRIRIGFVRLEPYVAPIHPPIAAAAARIGRLRGRSPVPIA
jgi:hypothetical protein